MTERKGRRVKCYATGEYGNSLEYVQHDKHWWKNEEVYQQFIKNKIYRDKAYNLYSLIIGYEKGQVFSGYIHKRFKKLSYYGWECIYQNMMECRSSMEWAVLHKDFENDVVQAAYLFAIMESNINGCYSRMRKQAIEENRNKVLAERAARYVNDVDLTSVQNAPKKNRDISQWLEDEE